MSDSLPYENLLLAVLALREGYIDRAQLVELTDLWASHGSRSPGEWLIQQGYATSEQLSHLEEQRRQFVAQHDGDLQASLQAVCATDADVWEVSSGFLPDLQQLLPGLMATQPGTEDGG